MAQCGRSSQILFFLCIMPIFSRQAHSTTSVLPPPSEVYLSLTIRDVTFDLYKQLVGYHGNFVCSPFGFTIPLAMLLPGAASETASEIRKALHYSDLGFKEEPARDAYFTEILREKERQNRDYEYYMSNSMWFQSGINISTSYNETVTKMFAAEVNEVDFNKQISTDKINHWVKKETNGRITKLLDSSLSTETPLVMINTGYFNITFEPIADKFVATTYPFTCVLSKSGVFRRVVKTLNFQGKYLYGRSLFMKSDFQLVEIPYKKGRFGLILVVPKTEDGLSVLEGNLNYHLDSDIYKMKMTDDVVVSIPEFTVSSFWKMQEKMNALGVRKAFQKTEADFSGISKDDKVFVGDIFQSATVSVDDSDVKRFQHHIDGIKDPKTIKVLANHPFMFIIRDKANGFNLFIGRVVCL